jgi:toluene monooxygenase system protein D
MNPPLHVQRGVGPVLQATPLARTIIAAIENENENVVVLDEGAYLRVLVPRVCRLSRAGLTAVSDPSSRFPADLEVVMSSFTGAMQLTEDGVVWRLAGEPPADPGADP